MKTEKNKSDDSLATKEDILWHLNHIEDTETRDYLIEKYLAEHIREPFTKEHLKESLSEQKYVLNFPPIEEDSLNEVQKLRLAKLKQFTDESAAKLDLPAIIWQPACRGNDESLFSHLLALYPIPGSDNGPLRLWTFTAEEFMSDESLFETLEEILDNLRLEMDLYNIDPTFEYSIGDDALTVVRHIEDDTSCMYYYETTINLSDIIDENGTLIEDALRSKLDKFKERINHDNDHDTGVKMLNHLVYKGNYIYQDTLPKEDFKSHISTLKNNRYSLFFRGTTFNENSIDRSLSYISKDKPAHDLNYTTPYHH